MIDITNLTSLITAFRNETEQGSISPETLGALLQAIAEEIQNATSEQDQVKLTALYDNIKTMGTCLQSITQGDADRNNILANIVQFNPILGAATISSGGVFIKQATTERAGAMRAQHVDDLYTAKKNISALQSSVEDLQSSITSLEEINTTHEELISDLCEDTSTVQNYVQRLPPYRGVITIDSTSITSPSTNYFKYSMADGYYEIYRAGNLIGHAVSYLYNNYRIFNVVGLCFINSTTFVYQDTLEHILVRVTSSGQIYTSGTTESTDLQNQIYVLQKNSLTEETTTFSYSDDNGNSISGTCYKQGSLCTIIGKAYIEMEQTEVNTLLPFNAVAPCLPELDIYYEDTMQWVKVSLYNDTSGTHISARIPEDFMNGGEVFVKFSLSYIIQS